MNKQGIKAKRSTIGIVIVLIFAGIYPFLFGQAGYFMSLGMRVAIMAIYAISYNLLLGYTGIVSLGQALFFGLGGYTSAILVLRHGWSFWLTLIPTAIMCLVVALSIGFLTLRVKDIYFTMLTLALGQLLYVAANKAYNFTGGEDGIPGVPGLFSNKTISYYVILLILILVYILVYRIINSPTGKVLQAIRENEMRTGVIGYDVLSYKLIVLAFSGVLSGIAGALYVTYSGIAYPALANSEMTQQAIFMTVIGGSGTMFGPVLGAAIVVIISTILNTFTNRWMLFFGIVFVLVIMFMPGGIMGLIKSEPWKKKKGDKVKS